MRVYTSRYANPELALRDDLVKVGITLYPPRWRLPYHVAAYVRVLAPNRAIFGVEDRATFEPLFRARLEALDPEHILARLRALSEAHGGLDLVLLCFENLDEPGEWCHRRMVAGWLAGISGQSVDELEMPSNQPRLL